MSLGVVQDALSNLANSFLIWRQCVKSKAAYPVLYKRWRYCGNPKFLVHVIKVFASYELVSVSLCDDSINVPVHLVLCDSMQVIHHPVVLFCRTPLYLAVQVFVY